MRRTDLPLGDDGATVEYLRAAAALGPPPSSLEPLIAEGGRLPLPEADQR